MCGITGWFNSSSVKNYDLLRDMCEQIHHRGPDFTSFNLFTHGKLSQNVGNVGLGHTRLSIIDLSPQGNQPMSDATGRWWIIFNGEIYNYKEIKHRLLSQFRIKLRSNTDTEILLYAYIYYKEKSLELMNGMFAFAIFDSKEQELFIARDRIGIKPLYYYENDGEFAFGSELKPIYHYLQNSFNLNQHALYDYFNRGYIGGTHTIAHNIKRLLPATWIRVSHNKESVPHVYWSINTEKVRSMEYARDINESKIVSATHQTIYQAIKSQLMSDVPIGTFLSGGIDSSLVTAIAAKEMPGQLKTFTIGFKDPCYDESGYARRIAQYLHTDHHELIIDETDFLAACEEMTQIYDEPFADSSAIPTLLLSRFARNFITVALSGDGGDEQYYGYATYDHYKKLQALYKIPYWIRKLFASFLVKKDKMGFDFLLKSASLGYKDFETCRRNITNILSVVPGLLRSPSRSNIKNSIAAGLLSENRFMIDDLMNYMVDDVLTKVDRASMHCGLEVRVPLLDQTIVENSYYGIPLSLKLTKIKKAVLKRLLAEYIPRDFFERPKKGFAIPITNWVNGRLKSNIMHLINHKNRLSEFLNMEIVQKMFNNPKILQSKYGSIFFWRVYIFLLWEKQYLKND